jgi:endonuclease YncB( thermonuclease family)
LSFRRRHHPHWRSHFRLWSIDAPEAKQTCPDGWQAAATASRVLQSLMEGRRIECEPRDRDCYGRTVAVCRADGRDLEMVRASMELAFVRYSSDYVQEEAQARVKRLGLLAHGRPPLPARGLTRRTSRN